MGRVVVDDVRDCRVRHTSQLGYLFEYRGQISSRERSQTEREYLLIQERRKWALVLGALSSQIYHNPCGLSRSSLNCDLRHLLLTGFASTFPENKRKSSAGQMSRLHIFDLRSGE